MPGRGFGPPNVDPGFNRQQPPQGGGGRFGAGGPPDLNGAERGMGYGGALNPNGENFGKMRVGMPGGQMPEQSPDYFGQLNAFQADIGGEQPGPFAAGWGGAGGGRGTMDMTKVNSWLNTFQDPTQRAQAMNGIGYFNGGNPYTPEVQKGTNQFYRGNARENQQTGGMSAPGTYLHQSSYAPLANGMPNMNFGGYVGATQVGDDGSAQYTPWDVNARGRTRRTRTFGQVM